MNRIFTTSEKRIILSLTALLMVGGITKILKEKGFYDSAETLKLLAVSEEINSIYSGNQTSADAPDSLAGRINLNTADEIDLVRLPGVGPKLAKRIIEKREELDGFKSVEDLLKVTGIGEKKFENIKSIVTI